MMNINLMKINNLFLREFYILHLIFIIQVVHQDLVYLILMKNLFKKLKEEMKKNLQELNNLTLIKYKL